MSVEFTQADEIEEGPSLWILDLELRMLELAVNEFCDATDTAARMARQLPLYSFMRRPPLTEV